MTDAGVSGIGDEGNVLVLEVGLPAWAAFPIRRIGSDSPRSRSRPENASRYPPRNMLWGVAAVSDREQVSPGDRVLLANLPVGARAPPPPGIADIVARRTCHATGSCATDLNGSHGGGEGFPGVCC